MRNLFLLALLTAATLGSGCGRSGAQSDSVALPDLQGQYRVIATFAPDSDRAEQLINAFKSSPGLDERDIAWFVVGPDTIESNIENVPTRDRLEQLHSSDGFQAILLGKDGTIKASQLGGLDIQELLNAIDQMPMRQQEMQRSS